MMATSRPSSGFNRRSRLRLPSSSKAPKEEKPRPIISGPIGPIKNSRGADFTRSETLIIVPGIKDCGSGESLLEQDTALAKKTTRRISASFSSQGSLARNPTIATSDIEAITTSEAPSIQTSSRHSRNTSFNTLSSNCRPTLAVIAVGCSPRLITIRPPQDENIPPSSSGSVQTSASASKLSSQSQIPNSRTMAVLKDLRKSISRPSLSARSANSQNLGSSSRKTSESSLLTAPLTSSSSRPRIPSSSLTSLSRSSRPDTPEPYAQSQLQVVTTAQPSAYWSGRFMTLHDRYATEWLLKPRLNPTPSPPVDATRLTSSTPDRFPPRSSSFRPTHLSHSITMSALIEVPFPAQRKPPTNDEEIVCLRIFSHLEALCTTSEARRSLFDFQQTYARRCNRPGLLPEGGTMEDKSLMNKLFGGGTRKNERRSLSTLRESSNSQAVKKALAGGGMRSRGRRLTMY